MGCSVRTTSASTCTSGRASAWARSPSARRDASATTPLHAAPRADGAFAHVRNRTPPPPARRRSFLASCRRLLSCTYEVRRGGGLVVTYQGREVAITCSHMGVVPSLLSANEPNLHPPPGEAPLISTALSPTSGRVHRHQSLDVASLRKLLDGCVCFASVDLLEGLKGVPLKLLAFENLLHASPAATAATLRLVLVGMIPDARPDDHQRCRREVVLLVERINASFPRAVHFIERHSCHLRERLALWAVTDILVVTSVREGLNLLPIEYILARQRMTPGAIVLSEFCSLARVFSGCLTCNPWSVRKVSAALQRALQLPSEARAARAASDLSWCLQNTASAWAQRVLRDVAAAAKPADAGLDGSSGLGLGLGWRRQSKFGHGLTEGRSFSRLRDEDLLSDYRRASRRLLVFDHLGTLVPSPYAHQAPPPPVSPMASSSSLAHLADCTQAATAGLGSAAEEGGLASLLGQRSSAPNCLSRSGSVDGGRYDGPPDRLSPYGAVRERPKGAMPSASVRNSLEVLCADSCNTVVVMSTGEREEVSAAYGSVPGCSLCADNGLYVALSGLNGRWDMAGGVSWELSDAAKRGGAGALEEWHGLALSVISLYVERTNGAYVESARNGLAFDFRWCDPEFGLMQAKELQGHLSDVLQDYSVDLKLEPSRLALQPRGIDKGGLLRQAIKATAPDFVLVVGDDGSDEPAFAALAEWMQEHGAATPPASAGKPATAGMTPPSLPPSGGGGGGQAVGYGCVVGKKPSHAAFFVDDQGAAAGLLETLKWGSLRASRSVSIEGALSSLDTVLGSEWPCSGSRSLSSVSCSANALARSADSLPSVDAQGMRGDGPTAPLGPGTPAPPAAHACAASAHTAVGSVGGAAVATAGSMAGAVGALRRPQPPAQPQPQPHQQHSHPHPRPQLPLRGGAPHTGARAIPDGVPQPPLAATHTPAPCEPPATSTTSPPPPPPPRGTSTGCPYQQNPPLHNLEGEAGALAAPGSTLAVGAMCAAIAAFALRSGRLSGHHRRRRVVLLVVVTALAVPRLRFALLRAMAVLGWLTSARLPDRRADPALSEVRQKAQSRG